jgi:hypothetical protein
MTAERTGGGPMHRRHRVILYSAKAGTHTSWVPIEHIDFDSARTAEELAERLQRFVAEVKSAFQPGAH